MKTKPRRRFKEVFVLDDEQDAELSYPMPLSMDELSDFKEWLALTLRKVERLSHEAALADAPSVEVSQPLGAE